MVYTIAQKNKNKTNKTIKIHIVSIEAISDQILEHLGRVEGGAIMMENVLAFELQKITN